MTMTMQHPEIYPNKQRGATRQQRRLPALQPILKGLMDNVSNPHEIENRKFIKDQFLQFINSAAGTQYHETVYLYWFDNHYRHLLNDYPEPETDIAKNGERRTTLKTMKEKNIAKLTERVETAITEKAQIILLNWVLPNGKALRDCTGRECREMSGKTGGWLRKISERVKPTQIVGNVLQESDVRKLYGKD